MNTLLSNALLIGICSASLASAQQGNNAANGRAGASPEDEWTVMLVQKNLESAAVFQSEVAMEGTGVSFAPVPEGGSEFNLWAFRHLVEGGVQEHLIDTEVVGAYLPEGRIWVTTEDPYTGGIPRTRVDRGFTLNYEVDGLLTGAESPLAARKVLLDHNLASATGTPQDLTLAPEEDFAQVFIDRNGTGSYPFPASNLPGTDLSQISGQEIFRLYALPDGQVAELELSSAQVQIWPMATASFSGVTENESYTTVPQINVALENLYPSSETWVQYYPGPYQAGTTGTRVAENPVYAPEDTPLNSQMELHRLDSVLLEAGGWTLEVVTRTPFGIEGIAHTSFNIDRDLKLRGSFQTLNE